MSIVDQTQHQESLWDALDVARYLKTSRSWVYMHANSGELPCRRIGGLLRFDPGAVRAYARGENQAAGVISILKGGL